MPDIPEQAIRAAERAIAAAMADPQCRTGDTPPSTHPDDNAIKQWIRANPKEFEAWVRQAEPHARLYRRLHEVTVHRYLVTGDEDQRMDTWSPTAGYTNWIEGSENGNRETWLVTCYAEHAKAFLRDAEAAGVTVEQINGAGDTETYTLVIGNPGSGWEGRAT